MERIISIDASRGIARTTDGMRERVRTATAEETKEAESWQGYGGFAKPEDLEKE